MIDLYFWMTPNGYKISILIEELALPYRVIPVHIGKGEQFAEDFLRISPNGKIPAITDANGSDGAPISIFESGAIMIYLANRYGKQFLPERERALRGPAMADVSDGGSRPNARPGPPFP
jgi:GST-like protein